MVQLFVKYLGVRTKRMQQYAADTGSVGSLNDDSQAGITHQGSADSLATLGLIYCKPAKNQTGPTLCGGFLEKINSIFSARQPFKADWA